MKLSNKMVENVKLAGQPAAIQNQVIGQEEFEQMDYMFDEEHKYEQVYEKLIEKYNNGGSQNVDVLWRLGRVLYMKACEDGIKHSKEKELLFEAQKYCSAGHEINPKDFECIRWAAIVTGALSDRGKLGNREKIQMGNQFKEYLEKGLEIVEDDHILAHLYGRLCFSIANLSWVERNLASVLYGKPPEGTMQDALEKFKKVEEVKPAEWIENMLYLGKTLLALGQKEEMVKVLKSADSVEPINLLEENAKKECYLPRDLVEGTYDGHLHRGIRTRMASLRPILYGRWSSSCTWRVQNALEYKGIQYEGRHVHVDQQKSEQFLHLNPLGQIPILVHGRQVLTESMGIIEFLEEEYPMTPTLLGGDSYQRATIRALSLMIVSAIQPLQNIGTLRFVNENGMDPQKFADNFIRKGFKALEQRLDRTAGEYCIGDRISLVDVCLVPQVFNATKKYNMDVSEFKLIDQINKNLSKVPSFQRAHALAQPDAPAQVKEREQSL
ncbi:unnamed protein product [Bursaphelenchus okinawaensis]|uniref:maleylacetoacetate isomerase n=1 Tax=Bursaphelenchus okinawaensis TaxID=465554 RepID=A0A811LHH7_9BILA|nr:unnamed protein product [Bursaphelenchus okinawaensis]CAG9125511.1 unnamed protein product [Bursaphelenchus okinawaensis]